MFTHVLRRAAAAVATAFIATLIAACGGQDYSAAVSAVPGAPVIASFAAAPASQPFGGGQTVLSWSAPGATTLVIDGGVGDVSGLASKAVKVTANTTFTLTASNPYGSATATTAVTVAAQPAPAIASFIATPASLPAGGGSVTLSWATTNATTLSIDNGVGAVTGTSKVVSVAANTTFTLTATNAAGAVNKTTSVAVAVTASSNLFIDAALGADTNPCTQALPCKTMTKALSVVPAASIFSLADGVYDTTTQGFGVRLPAGATLRAINPGGATVKGVVIDIADGSATIDGLVLDVDTTAGCAAIHAYGSSGTPTLTLTGVLIKCIKLPQGVQLGGTLQIGGLVKATMTPGALPGGIYTAGLPDSAFPVVNLEGTAELLITGGVIDGNNLGQAVGSGGLMVVTENSKLTLDGVTVRNRTQPVLAVQRTGNFGNFGQAFIPTIVLRNGTLIDNVGAANRCEDGAAIAMRNDGGSLTMDHATLSNTAGVGICVGTGSNNAINGGSASVNLIQSTITRAGTAAISSALGGGTLTVDGSSFTNNHNGILWVTSRGSPSFDLRNTTITGDGIAGGIGVSLILPSGTLKMRGSTVSNNADSGVRLQGTMTTDLGKAGDPGGNTFTGTGLTGLRDFVDPGQFVDAVGNTWKPNQQGANANGYYSVPPLFAPVPQMGPASGTNFIISGTTTLNL